MKHFDISLLLVVSQKVMPDVYVLCAAVFNRIIRHADSTLIITYTTGISSFVVCLRHTTKAILHSAKPLPSVTLGKERSVNCTSTTASLPSTFCRALGKELGKEKSPSRRQVTVTDLLPSVFVGTRQRRLLCRVSSGLALGKESSSGPLCQPLCRVPSS